MKKVKLFAYLLVYLFAVSACDNDDNDDNLVGEMDRNFVIAAADGGMLEVRLGEMAQERGMSQSVKAFGQMMVDDHTKANNEIMSIASSKGINFPATLSTAKQQKVDSLMARQGMAFDSTFANMMINSHKETIALFQNQNGTGRDAELTNWAAGKLPALQQHLNGAMMLRDSIRNMTNP
ncbi:DUF4142 domain-containing protein [Arundinibacter roseus]|uniref:DUF4142 domain-containing protein n=1 Tax=Arundinibacter roseus TaxID=2070510 RepID=A0A4R4KHD6_9BACT|nr:DUF4142 domain-containing protein [Arundinibacter roseus]TDB67497.1 DUF4142 domain-containing protein [Arundinibacter roseus]